MTGPGARRRVSMRTLGCKVNSFESEQILQSLVDSGNWLAAQKDEGADLYIINSCTVTREADRQTRQEIRRCVRENPNSRVVVTGCYAQMDPETCAGINGVDLVVGNAAKLKIPSLLQKLEEGRLPRILTPEDLDDELLGLPDPSLSGFSDRARAFIQIQQGCDQGCTFCIIHKARGESRSLAADAICAQVSKLHKAGFNEFVICGVDLGSYGNDAPSGEQLQLPALLERILAVPGDFKLRLGSLDPVHMTDELLEFMAANERICRHLHISMQSGHTLILKRMKRRYNRDTLYERVLRARDLMPELVLGADIMAGFPTEDESHFLASLEAITELGIAFPHVFPYSERPGTPAARIPRQVDPAERTRRAARLRQAGAAVLSRELGRQCGTTQPVLLESRRKDGDFFGRLDNYLPVQLAGDDLLPGSRVRVRLKDHDGSRLHGEFGK